MFRRSFLLAFLLMCSTLLGAEPIPSASREMLTFPILFVQRNNYQGLHIYDTFYQWRRGGTSGIYILENPADPPEQHRIRTIIDPTTQPTLGDGNYFDASLSYDAKKILFCYKNSNHGNSVIYEIGVDGQGLRQLTSLDAEGNPYNGGGSGHHDVRPAYLPDGRIVFTSTRYSGLVPCANNGVAILHVMNADGSDLHTISVNNVTEFDPSVLPDGRILFGRWEYIDKNALTIQSLWSIYPDGRNETAIFANNLVFPEAILQAKPVPGCDNLVVGTFAPHNAPPRGTIAMIDIAAGIQNSVTGKNDIGTIYNFEYPDRPTFDRGQSCDPWALNENVVLFSGQIPNSANGGKFNSLLLVDRTGTKTEVCSNANIDLHNPIPLLPRPVPPVIADQTDRSQTEGSFYVTDVYQGLSDVKRGSVKWLRVVEETSRITASPGGNRLNQTFSVSAALAWSEKIYHGIVPVEADGSVYFAAPSGRALYFQLLDENYRLVRGMRTFVQAAPGTVRSCTGCHEYGPPQGALRRANLAGRELQRLRSESWGTGYMDYASMVQPILDAHCVSCHGGAEGIAAGLDLSGAPNEWFNISYNNLTERREKMYWADLIAGIGCMNGTAYFSCKIFPPYSHGSGKAPLADLLLNDEIHKTLLSPPEKELLFAWLDSNGLYFGTWNYTASGPQLLPYAQAQEAIRQIMAESSCADCHTDAEGKISRFETDWINLDRPEFSRVLRAPLASGKDAPYGLGVCRNHKIDSKFFRSGLLYGKPYVHQVQELDSFPTQEWRKIPEEGEAVVSLSGADDPLYVKMLGVIREAQTQAYASPRVDMPSAALQGKMIFGRYRQILPQPLPEQAPKTDVKKGESGDVILTWEHSAAMMGLIFRIYRSEKPDFTPSDETFLAETEGFMYVDKTASSGRWHYALVLVSDPAKTCGACGQGRCPLSQTAERSSQPIYFPVLTE